MASADSGSQRILALDFTKGVLVLFMVVYHWINLFIGIHSELLRYLRFLTPSFIFITGFLISAMYFGRYDVDDPAVSRRLAWRGVRILGLFVILNGLISMLSGYSHDRDMADAISVNNLFSIYVIGNTAVAGIGKVASFFILIPISYLLLLSAGFLVMQARSQNFVFGGNSARTGRLDGAARIKYMFCSAWLLFLLGIFVLHLKGFESSNLELLCIGLLGIVIGHVPLQSIDGLAKHPYTLAIAYVCYVMAITVWNVVFPLQIIGVCLSLLIIYLAGRREGRLEGVRERIMLFGRYSLLGYIGQIAVIQLLFRGLRQFSLETVQLGASLLGAFALTVLIIEVVDRVRERSATMDKMYRAVFA